MIVDNIEVYQAAQAEQYPEPISREIVSLYDRARTNAFAITMLAVAFVCAIGYLTSANLPGRSMEELTADTGAL